MLKNDYHIAGEDLFAEKKTYFGINTVSELFAALKKVWCKKTCAPRLRDKWSPENPSLGQCSITAFLAQDIFGGKVFGVLLGDGNYHCYNKVGDTVFDLTSAQFEGERLEYLLQNEQSREEHFLNSEKKERYELLIKRLKSLTDGNAVLEGEDLLKSDPKITLEKLADADYRDFLSALVPEVLKDKILGVRSPQLKKLARSLAGSGAAERFMRSTPHEYLEENTLHAFLINEEKDFAKCVRLLDVFLPFVDNWATCDSIKPKVFLKNKERLMPFLYGWGKSGKTYAVRYAVGGFMTYALGEDFLPDTMEFVANIYSENYYVNMMRAWYFATALFKNRESAMEYITSDKLDLFTKNKAIDKAVESFRISAADKELLKTIKKRKT